MYKKILIVLGLILVLLLGGYFYRGHTTNILKANPKMSFFITSHNPGKGGDLGGLPQADAFCQMLGDEEVKGKTWAAYLSTKDENARDRIGQGPWYNYYGDLIANNLDELHASNNLNKETAVTEKGQKVNGRGDNPNIHDIMTGSDMEGRFYSTTTDTTCESWTSGDRGQAMVGHHDRIGINDSPEMHSWTSSHLSRGCSLDALKTTGGAGLIYCFAK